MFKWLKRQNKMDVQIYPTGESSTLDNIGISQVGES